MMWRSDATAPGAKHEIISLDEEIDKSGGGLSMGHCIEDNLNVATNLTCNICKCNFYNLNDLVTHITNSVSCSVNTTPKIMLSDHLCTERSSVDEDTSDPYMNDAQIPAIFRHRLLSTFLNKTQSKEVNTDVNNIYNAINCFKETIFSTHEEPHRLINSDSNNLETNSSTHEGLQRVIDSNHLTIPQIQKVQARVRTHTMFKVKCSFNNCNSISGTYSRLLHDVLDDLLKSAANAPNFENMEYRLSMFHECYDVIPQMVLCLNHVQYLSGAFKRSNAQWQRYIEKEDDTELCLSKFLKGFGGKDFSYSNFDELYDEMDALKEKATQNSILSYIDS